MAWTPGGAGGRRGGGRGGFYSYDWLEKLLGLDSTTRLVVRVRSIYTWKPGEPLFTLFIEPGQFLLERQMMRGIKRRAEALAEHRREPRAEGDVLPAGV